MALHPRTKQRWLVIALASAGVLVTGPAAAEGLDELPVAKDIRIRAQDDALLVDYQFDRGYDADDVRITRSGRLLRVTFPDARLRGKKRWPRARDRWVKGSYANQTSRSSFRHKLRLAKRVDTNDVRVERFGDKVVVRVPKNASGMSVSMAPEGYTAAAPASKPEASVVASVMDAEAKVEPTKREVASDAEGAPSADERDRGRQELLEELLNGTASSGKASTKDSEPLPFYGAAKDTTSKAKPTLAGMGSDLPEVNPLVWILVVLGMGLLAIPLVRRGRFARLGAKADSPSIRVLDRKAVVGKTGVALLEAAGRLVLVGTSDNGLTALADLGPSDEDFRDVVARASQATAIEAPEGPAEIAAPPSAQPVAHGIADEIPASVKAVNDFRAKVAALRSA